MARVAATYLQPFDLLAKTTDIVARHAAEITVNSAKSEIWLPEQDSNLRPID
jgi:hypothetical protein